MEVKNSFAEKYSVLFREEEIEFISQFFGNAGIQHRPLFIYGPRATGKTFVVSKLLKYFSKTFVWINCFEHVTLASLLNAVKDLISKNNQEKITNICQFVNMLKEELKETSETLYLVLDSVQVIRNLDPSLMHTLMMLQDITGVNICPVLISRMPWYDLIDQHNTLNPVSLHFPNYSIKEMGELLVLHCPPECKKTFYAGYVNIIIKTFFPVVRNLTELLRIAKLNFAKYCEPLKDDPMEEPNMARLYKNIQPTLKSALNYLHFRDAPGSIWKTYNEDDEESNILPNLTLATISPELAYYMKILMISAYFASFNYKMNDFKHSVKNQRKQAKKKFKKKLQKNRHLLGPKPFDLERLMSIFYSLAGISVFSFLTYSQISCLVNNNLLAKVSADDKLEGQTYKCLMKLELVQKVGKTVGIDVMGYLYDYM